MSFALVVASVKHEALPDTAERPTPCKTTGFLKGLQLQPSCYEAVRYLLRDNQVLEFVLTLLRSGVLCHHVEVDLSRPSQRCPVSDKTCGGNFVLN
jgi:hypothetical protein